MTALVYLVLSKVYPVLACVSWWNSMADQITSSSLSMRSMAISLIALSTMLCTSSSKLCRLRFSKSASVVSSLITKLTRVAVTSCERTSHVIMLYVSFIYSLVLNRCHVIADMTYIFHKYPSIQDRQHQLLSEDYRAQEPSIFLPITSSHCLGKSLRP